MLAAYYQGLGWVFRHQFLTLLSTLALIVLTGYLYYLIPKGFFPEQDTGFIFGEAEARQDISFEAMAKIENQLSNIITEDPAVFGVVGFVGATGGNSSENTASMFIQLKPFGERPQIEEVMQRLRPKVAQVVGAKYYMQAGQDVTVGGRLEQAQYQYTLTDTNSDELNHWAPIILAKMEQIKNLTDVASDQQISSPQITVEVDRDAASTFGVTVGAVDAALYAAFGQQQVATIYTSTQQPRVIVEVQPEFQMGPTDLSTIYVASSSGSQVPLSALAHYTNQVVPLTINHQGVFPSVTLSFNLAPGAALSQAVDAILGLREQLHAPGTLLGTFQGTAQAFQASLTSTPLLIIAAILAAWDWGPMLVARHLWRELGLEATLDKLAAPRSRDATRLSDRALVLVVNRLTAPGSEHGLARWLETDFVCDRLGRRWLAAWRDEAERLASRTPRVRVELRQLKTWYRTLDQLREHKDAIEYALFITLRDLFSLKIDLVFYDLTSTYFEGHGPAGIGANGHSRDGKPRNPQVLVGLVVVDGWPIAHHVFAGNRCDAKTVPAVLRDLEARFGLRRVVFVGDRGMVTSHNLDDLRTHGHGYIVGRNRRRSGEVFDYIQSATGPWIECPAGITAREKASSPKTLVQEVASNQPGVRVFVIHSEERAAFECRHRTKAMERVRLRLEKLERRVAKGRLKAPEKVGAAAARVLARNHGHRYYDWSYEDGAFRFFEHPLHFAREQAYEGKYVIQTEEADLSAVDAVRLYKELSDVERCFANLKDVIEMRPVYHHTPERVEAHIFVAALAFVLHRAIEKKLKTARLDLSATEALTVLRSIRLVDIDLGNGTTKRSVTAPSPRAAAVLRAIGISDLDPPTPPIPGQTVM